MNSTAPLSLPTDQTVLSLRPALRQAVAAACARIAPTWPLDQFIAVNPYWGFIDQPIQQCAARLGRLSGAGLLMPRSEMQAHWRAGRLQVSHLASAVAVSTAESTAAANPAVTLEELIAHLHRPSIAPRRLPLVSDQTPVSTSASTSATHHPPWRDIVTHQLSQHCAAYFDAGQASWGLGLGSQAGSGLYPSWREHAAHDIGPSLLTGLQGWEAKVARLPHDPQRLMAEACEALGVSDEAAEPYFTALLLSINGWAAWCAYERWQARLAQQPLDAFDALGHLLAARLAWEWILAPETGPAPQPQAFASVPLEPLTRVHQLDWLLQLAMERAYQAPLCAELLAAATQPASPAPVDSAQPAEPAVQAVFCIDVRSEVFRRALEASTSQVHTRGFAGFFGLPISYAPLGSAMSRPQLPGLLAPSRPITEQCDSPALGQLLARRRQQRGQWQQLWQAFRTRASSGFSFVESCGLFYAAPLLNRSLARPGKAQPAEHSHLSADEQAQLRPRWPALREQPDEAATELKSRCDMAAGILGAMGLTQGFARLVLLAGHGSQSVNNPHAAGLDCGACGGQTGEINARVLTALLNEPLLRADLRERGLDIPSGTWFIAGLHNTTTDDMTLYETSSVPSSHARDVSQLQTWLAQAAASARAERAEALGLGHLSRPEPGQAALLSRLMRTRANDWAQVRPEWGLANNAAFIVAPRARTQALNLQGRAFLHDYDWQQDDDSGVLTLIMTAPMVVTHWINMQYHASTVDNPRYGSGNKVLHNVVGGRLGVFEGNGGDLRIGLPWQSLHDGEVLRHTPLRLSVFIEAPQARISAVIQQHVLLQQLLNHGWLHLFQMTLAGAAPSISRYGQGRWLTEEAAAPVSATC